MDNGYSFELLISYQSISLVGCFRGFQDTIHPSNYPNIVQAGRLPPDIYDIGGSPSEPSTLQLELLILHWNIIDGDLPS